MKKRKKAECPNCGNKTWEDRIKEKSGKLMCQVCRRRNHRAELNNSLPKLPRIKPGPKPRQNLYLLHPEQFSRKRFCPWRAPIKNIEKIVLWVDLKKEGFSDEEIKKRIKKLEWNVKLNHIKEFERRQKDGK